MAETPWILSNPLFSDIIFPFLLIFVLIFAILDRTKILGEDKRQINALVSLAIALIFLSFSRAVGVVKNLIPFVAVFAVIILVFLILYGFIASDKEGLKIPVGMKIAGGIVILIALVIAVLIATSSWNKFVELLTGGSKITTSIIFIVIIGAAVAVILSMGGKKD